MYRKNTFSGLGMSYFSFDLFRYKCNAVKTLLFRAFKISSTYNLMNIEFDFLKRFFLNNGYPLKLINNEIKLFLDNIFQKKSIVSTVPKLNMYIKMKYLGKHSDKMKMEILKLIDSMYPYLKLNIIFTNNYKTRIFFKYKEDLPAYMRSMIIYNYCCAQCGASYVGSTRLTLHSRAS